MNVGRSTIQQLARRGGMVALLLDHEAVEFYIDLLHSYNASRTPRDEAVAADEQFLRDQAELLWGDDGFD